MVTVRLLRSVDLQESSDQEGRRGSFSCCHVELLPSCQSKKPSRDSKWFCHRHFRSLTQSGVSFRKEKLPGFQLSVWPWAPINLAAVTRSPCIGGNTSGWDERRRRAVERGGDWRFSKAPSMSAGLDAALSTQASYWRERQNQFPPLQTGETLARLPRETEKKSRRKVERFFLH